jgi:hypothetical protein
VSTEAGGCRPALAGLRPAISGVSSEAVELAAMLGVGEAGLRLGAWCERAEAEQRAGQRLGRANWRCGPRRSWAAVALRAWRGALRRSEREHGAQAGVAERGGRLGVHAQLSSEAGAGGVAATRVA